MAGYRGRASPGMGRGSRYQLWILVAAASPLELGGHGGRGLSVLEVGQVSLRELRPQARRDQEALLRAYAGGDQSHLPILIDGGLKNEESTRMDDTWDRLFGRLCGYYDSRTGAADGYRPRREERWLEHVGDRLIIDMKLALDELSLPATGVWSVRR